MYRIHVRLAKVVAVVSMLVFLEADVAFGGAPLTSPSNVHVQVGNGQATVTWGPSSPSQKVAYYLVMAFRHPAGAGIKFIKTKALHATLTGLVNGASYSFSVGAAGVNSLTTYSKVVEAGTFTIGSQTSGGTSTGVSSGVLDACAITIGNWVISTSNFSQTYPNSIPPVITTFGQSSPIEQWVLSQLGNFLSQMVQMGQSAADSTLLASAKAECGVLQRSGINIAAIQAAQ